MNLHLIFIVEFGNFTDRIEFMGCKYGFDKYLRAIRVYFTNIPIEEPIKPIQLSYRIFIPKLLKLPRKYEIFNELFNREIKPFIIYNKNSKVINYELFPIQRKGNFDTMIRDGSRYSFIFCLKIYFDGPVVEPPGENFKQQILLPANRTCSII